MFLGLLALVWMNALLQPCLMAMEMPHEDQHSISMHEAMADHASHETDRSCEHCPPSVAHVGEECASAVMSECASLPDFKHSVRYLELESNDFFNAVDTLCSVVYDVVDTTAAAIRPARDWESIPEFHPPLNIQYCVFLK